MGAGLPEVDEETEDESRPRFRHILLTFRLYMPMQFRDHAIRGRAVRIKIEHVNLLVGH